ncbi:sigma-70 family RNA polymerase sigma factor [Natrialba swarupiae]|uniref:Uncharacterized protein n=1 Tax=Natrialba swarupiae TaxID=2448032 RepID=A0A5D5AS66_9EURY|nr:hypothetical protein [Natrialba swarupiae]TYT62340.1 hypothetical protein FYC77_08975 [Natrialba swarupiae]
MDRDVEAAIDREPSTEAAPTRHLYYARIHFDSDEAYDDRKRRLFRELGNALDVRDSYPPLADADPSVSLVELAFETAVPASAIVGALDHEFIRGVDYWKIETDGLESTESTPWPEPPIDALVAELESRRESRTDSIPRESVDDTRPDARTDPRVARVRSRIHSLETAIGALEERLGEEQTARYVLEEMRIDVDEVRSELSPAPDGGVDPRTDPAGVDPADSSSDELRRTIEGLENRLETVEAELEQQREWRRRLSRVIAGASGSESIPAKREESSAKRRGESSAER